MAFKKITPASAIPASPDQLLRTLPRRKIPDVLPHQKDVMAAYAAQAADKSDVAIQLPTGSGKTLVGLLTAEWCRRKNKDRVVYLCPTRQLVNQAAEQAEKYGLSVGAFSGSAKNYLPQDKADYRNADRIAVTTYNSLFNTNPFFSDADVIIIDDAHAAENYFSSMWSLRVERLEQKHVSLHAALAAVLKPHIETVNFVRLLGKVEGIADHSWVDKIPTPIFFGLIGQITEIFDTHSNADTEIKNSWKVLRDHLPACNMYVSSSEILIRPLLIPTWTHPAFTDARQRIFMSATLGAGGDLERLTGRKKIHRLPTPVGWNRQGVGRRFFIFPRMSLKPKEEERLRLSLMRKAGRSLVLVPNERLRKEVSALVRDHLGFPTFSATDIETSKAPFVGNSQAVAVVANRYDGIDFPGPECRLLFVEGLPKATNLQERFLMSRMGANILFNERVQTRVLQAIGRCTRSLEDFSAVVVSGEELPDYLSNIKKRPFFHPELQAELNFGVQQSRDVSVDELADNFRIFLENGEEWEDANDQILAERDQLQQKSLPGMDDLQKAAPFEIEWQLRLWQSDYQAALGAAESVLGILNGAELRGYRALWHYLAGSAAWLGTQSGSATLQGKVSSHFTQAKRAAIGIPWLVSLSQSGSEASAEEPGTHPSLLAQIENLETVLTDLGTTHDRNFAEREKDIREGLRRPETFEQAHRKLGELLGFKAQKVETDGSPDPWWMVGSFCFVFEDYVDATAGFIGVTKVRQVESHPNWIKANADGGLSCQIIPVLLSAADKLKDSALPHAKEAGYWKLSDFLTWSDKALETIRTLRTSYSEPGDLDWRATAISAFERDGLDANALYLKFKLHSRLKDLPIVAG